MLRILYSRPVGIMLGAPERAYLASPLRPVDLADLEALSYTAWGNPAELLPDKDKDTPESRQALKDALDLAEAGPASWRTTTDPQLASATTLAFLRSVLRAHEDMTDSDFSTLAHQLTPKQWTRLYRVAWGVDPVREIIQRIDTLLGFPPEPCDGVPWCVAIAELANETGWTLEQIGQIPLPAINLMRNGGKPVDPWESGPESPIIGDVGSPLQKAREAFFNG